MSSGSDYYKKMVERNVGIITNEQQEKLKECEIPIFGVGGLGGIVAELLARCGVGKLKIVDIDRFEASNLNRQVYAYASTLGMRKVDATEAFLKDINPGLEIEKYHKTDDETIACMLKNSKIAAMCIDQLVPSIHVARRCFENNITMLETVAIPYMNVRVYNRNTISFEAFHNFQTEEKTIDELYNLSEQENREIGECFIKAFVGLEDISSYFSDEAFNNMSKGCFPSFAPFVWLQASLLALETIKVLLDWGEISYAPEYAVYDPVKFRALPPVNLHLQKKTETKG
jgi:molybdopterin/thiamine biosynthesis adenylyltransferase